MAMPSTYLFINKKYRSQMTRPGKMSAPKQQLVFSESNFSLDSLEDDFKKKMYVKGGSPSSEHSEDLDTVLVPFYEKDVLVKVPKEQKRKHNKHSRSKEKEIEPNNTSYLVNKDYRKARRTTYLEMFRKKFSPEEKPNLKPNTNDIRSLSPEFGDTDRDSIGEDASHPVAEFYNTESYNEMFYEKILTQDVENYNSSYEDVLNKDDDVNIDSKLQQEMAIENLKSVSEVSQVNPHLRRGTIKQPMPNVKLGGLGPDVENIKPRLERARSLQRYSEKVRMENRLRIYKKTVQQENYKIERESSANQRKQRPESRIAAEPNVSYLVNKSATTQKTPQSKIMSPKSKSADPKKGKTVPETIYAPKNKPASRTNKKIESIANTAKNKRNDTGPARANSTTRNKGINTETKTSIEIPPVHINFMVNVGGLRPTSALINLEEKHRIYQEQVKAFKVDDE